MGLLDDAIREHLDLKRARGGDPAEIERLEREALGPLRREPPVPSHLAEPHGTQVGFFDPIVSNEDHLTDLEELQEHGYHDSTAPHLHAPHHESGPEHGEPPFADHQWAAGRADDRASHPSGAEQPKRRFLKRGRAGEPQSPGQPGQAGSDAHRHQGQANSERQLFDQHGEADYGTGAAYEGAFPNQPADGMPPQLQFEHPPKRPTFGGEQPVEISPEDSGNNWESPGERPRAGFPTPDEATVQRPEVGYTTGTPAEFDDTQETTEFEAQAHGSVPEAAEPDDVLEETPDFLQDTPEHDRLWFEQRPPKDFDFNG